MALITVVVPVYNVEEYLAWCLDSLCGQTLTDIEIIAVNDGSTDGSLDILRMYANKDDRIRIIDKENNGLSSARNAGIHAATSPLICFLDSDDRFTPNACARIVEAFDEGERSDSVPVDVVTFGANCYPDSLGYPWLREHLSPRDVTYAPFHIDLIFKEMSRPFAWRTACRTAFLRENDLLFEEDLRFGEDQVFHFAIYPRAKKTCMISDKLYDYRISRQGSLMERAQSNRLRMMLDHVDIMEAIFLDWKHAGYLDRYTCLMAAWVVEFMLFDSLVLEKAERAVALRAARDFLLGFWSIDQIEGMELPEPTANILAVALSGENVSDARARRLHTAWCRYSYGNMSAIKDVLKHILSLLHRKA